MSLFSLFACFRKKTPAHKPEGWLETHFPGRFTVVSQNINLDVKDFFKGKKTAVVAEKADPEVQFAIDWTKGDDGPGWYPRQIETLAAECKAGVADARRLHSALSASGLQQVSVGSDTTNVSIFVFAEPVPAERKRVLDAVLAVLASEPADRTGDVSVLLMEPAAYGQEFRDVVPQAFWRRPGSWFSDNLILTLGFSRMPKPDRAKLDAAWAVKPECRRSDAYRAEAYRQAQAWAAAHVTGRWYLEPDQMVTYQAVEGDPMALRFGFPLFDAKPEGEAPAEPGHYITGIYQVDSRKFSNIRKGKTGQ